MYASHLNQARWSGSSGRRDLVLLHVVEAAAVHLPELAADAGLAVVAPSSGSVERLVEQDEVERGADPGDRRDHVQPAEQQVEPVRDIRVEDSGDELIRRRHRSSAIATSSPSAVSSSSSVGLSMRLCSTSRISAFGRRFDEDDEPEPVPRLVLGVQAGELGEHRRVGVEPLLGCRSGREPPRLTDRGMRVEDLVLLVVRELVRRASGRARERIGSLGEELDEARPALEELARAPRRSAAAVARARERGDEERDVVVAVAELDLELDAPEERRRRMEDERVHARLELVGEACAPVGVGLGGRDLIVSAKELDA